MPRHNIYIHGRDWSTKQIEERLAELNGQIDSATSWGAWLTAADEERKELQTELRRRSPNMDVV